VKSELVLVPLDNNKMDLSGYIYPEKGFIYFEDFVKDKDIMTGFFGFLNPVKNNSYLKKLDMGEWFVVKVEYSNNIIFIDTLSNAVKFERGHIAYHGNLEDSLEYLENKKVEV